MRIVMIGSGAMGGSFGAFFADAGHEVRLVDNRADHVAAINRDGLRVEGARGDRTFRVEASTGVETPGWAEMAMVFVDSNATEAGAALAASALGEDGFAVTFQNGVGNVEKLQAAVGAQRVLGGSSMSSAASIGPGHVAYTHEGTASMGELDGARTERLAAMVAVFESSGFTVSVEDDILAKIWNKWVLNCAINPLCAATGLRIGEVARLPEMDVLQDRIIDEALAVIEAKGMTLPDPDVRATIKAQGRLKFSKPSMLQHVEAGRRTEIDAINGALVREAHALGIPCPYNEAMVALLKGAELHHMRAVHEPDLDYAALEAEATRTG